MDNKTDFIVVLPKTIITIPQDSYLAWLTLFYALPRELVEKRRAYLDLPRNVTKLLNDEHAKKLLKDDAFLELVWDCYAWSAWQFFQIPHKDGTYHDIPGDWKNYSGDFPLWRMSYDIIRYFRAKFEHEMEWSFQRLFMMPPDVEIPWLNYRQFSNLVGNLTDMVVAEQNWQPIIDEVWRSRDPADYNGSGSQKSDFNRSWNHDRKYHHHSLEEIATDGVAIDGELLYEIPNPSAEFESKLLDELRIADFRESLTDVDKKILQLRLEGVTLQEIAQAVGYKTASAVAKRIEKIAGRYEDFAEAEYHEFLEKHK